MILRTGLVLISFASCASRARAEIVGRDSPGSKQILWPEGVVTVSFVDASLDKLASSVFDELESKTFLKILKEDRPGGLAIRTSPKAIALDVEDRWTELCCFDPASSVAAVRRRLAVAFLRAVGVSEPDARLIPVINPSRHSRSVSVVSDSGVIEALAPEEADAVNALYASSVLPRPSSYPVRVDIGVYQLAYGDDEHANADWSEILDGRGRRVVAGAMRLARNLIAGGFIAGLVGILPTFIFKGNKAEVIFLGPESAELVGGSTLPREVHSVDSLGVSIRLATLYARGLTGRSFVGGVPTYLGDESALLLRSAHAKAVRVREFGESVEATISGHRSALAWSQASRWAQPRGGLMGIPSFVSMSGGGKSDVEVLILNASGFVEQAVGGSVLTPLVDSQDIPPGASANWSLGGALAMLWGTILTVVPCAYLLLYSRRCWGTQHMSRAERDLERLVASL